MQLIYFKLHVTIFMLIDLQLHSTYSDGYLTPTQLVQFIAKHNIKVASLTDHNTVGGLGEFKIACKKHNIKAINGLELYVRYKNKKMNMLWYNFNNTDSGLHKLLRETQIRRRQSVRKSLEKLIRRGFDININKTLDKYTHYTPLNHIVDDIKADSKNFKKIERELEMKNPREGFIMNEYFKNKKIGKLHESYIDIERILKLRKIIGGQIILNHPSKNGFIRPKTWEELKAKGVDGVEVLSPHHSINSVMYIQSLARQFGFIETGGSDYHRFEGEKYLIQSSFDYFKIDSEYLKGINKIIKA